MRTPLRSPSLGRLARLAAIGLLLAGCSSNPDKVDRPENPFKTAEGPGGAKSPLSDRELRLQAGQLYRRAHEALDSSDYGTAVTRYDQLIARYPFSDYSTQAELEKIYAHYKSYQADEATTEADRFMRAHPRHAHADYVLYLKGVTDFERGNGLLDSVLPSGTKRDVGYERRSFEDFALLLQRYPDSRYAGDARRRMLYSRNRIAEHELSVAEFYVSRGAYVAAAKRATDIVTEYPGAPASAEALKVLQRSYAKLGLEQEAKDTATLIAMNSDTLQYSDAPKPGLIERRAVPAAEAAGNGVAATDPGFMSRVTHLFNVFDTGKPDNQPVAPPASADAKSNGSAAPAVNPPAVNSPSASAPAETDAAGSGVMSRFAHMFNVFDTSKPENQHVVTVGGADAKSDGSATPAASPPATNGSAASSGPTADSPPRHNGVSLVYGGPDSTVGAAPPAQPTITKPAAAQPQATAVVPAQPAEEKKGFFSWFANLFSIFDSSKRNAPASSDTKPAGTVNSDTTK
ncbi:MAG: outer membrane protein assembly factor BamD [Nevskia sp.]|nr:outer membrane protein assembly factor BamD [Nevskia sp.]